MKRYQKRWIQLGIIIMFLMIAYSTYKIDFYRYMCENEPNKAACFMLGKTLTGEGKMSEGKYYLEKSCKMEYKLACSELKK